MHKSSTAFPQVSWPLSHDFRGLAGPVRSSITPGGESADGHNRRSIDRRSSHRAGRSRATASSRAAIRSPGGKAPSNGRRQGLQPVHPSRRAAVSAEANRSMESTANPCRSSRGRRPPASGRTRGWRSSGVEARTVQHGDQRDGDRGHIAGAAEFADETAVRPQRPDARRRSPHRRRASNAGRRWRRRRRTHRIEIQRRASRQAGVDAPVAGRRHHVRGGVDADHLAPAASSASVRCRRRSRDRGCARPVRGASRSTTRFPSAGTKAAWSPIALGAPGTVAVTASRPRPVVVHGLVHCGSCCRRPRLRCRPVAACRRESVRHRHGRTCRRKAFETAGFIDLPEPPRTPFSL